MSGEKNVSILGVIKMVLQGKQRGGDQEAVDPQDVLITPDRSLSLHNKLIGHDGTSERIVKVEDTRELGIVNHGKDSDGNVDALRTNAIKQLQVEIITSISSMLALLLVELRVTNMHLQAMSDLDVTVNDVNAD